MDGGYTMKRITTYLLAALLIASASAAHSDDLMLQPAAVVNLVRPQMISMQKLDEAFEEYRVNQQRQNLPVTETKDTLLQILIENELLLQGARRHGVSVSDQEIQAALNEQKQSVAQQLGQNITDEQFVQILKEYFGKTLEGFRQEIRDKLLVEKYVRSAKRDIIENVSAPSQQEVQTVYRQNATEFINPEFANIRHIFVDNRNKSDQEALDKINRALRRLNSGERSFSDLVLEVSEDESTKFSGGELGWLAINDTQRKQVLGSNFFDKVFDLSTGEISGVIQSNAGYHIVEMIEHRNAKVLGLQDPINPATRTTVYQYISNQIFVRNQAGAFNQAIDELVNALRKEADIRILL